MDLMKLLVTGGAGFVGSVCAKVLIEKGHEVVVVDDLSTGNIDAVPAGGKFVHDDFATAAGTLLGNGSFDGVMHFAAKSLIGESVTSPERYWHGNVVKTLSLLDAMCAAKNKASGVFVDCRHVWRAGESSDPRGCADAAH
jgi:UDP-glucose 4-epimerase